MQSSQKPHGKSAATRADRRVNPRNPFVATIELTESAHAPPLSGRVAEISRQLYFVDVPNVLPAGTMLKLPNTCDQGTFESKGKILYVQEGIGVRITFVDTPGRPG